MKRHLCILTSAHPIDDVRVHTKIARSFVEQGWRVTWVGPDVAAQGGTRDDDVEYRLVAAAGGRRGRLSAARRSARRAIDLDPVDWWYSPDPDAARQASRLARKRGGKAIFDIHEMFHGYHLSRWTFGRRVPPLEWLVRWRIRRTAKRSDLVIGVAASVLDAYTDGDALKIRNCAPRSFADASSTDVADGSGEVTVLHGKATALNGTEVVLDALGRLPTSAPKARVVMIHDPATSGLDPRQLEMSSPSVDLVTIPTLGHAEMPALTAAADIGLIANDRLLGAIALPNRIFEYLAGGCACLVPSYAPEMVDIVRSEDVGLAVDFEDPQAVADALAWLIAHPTQVADMGRRARTAFLERHNWDVEFSRLLDALEAIPGDGA